MKTFIYTLSEKSHDKSANPNQTISLYLVEDNEPRLLRNIGIRYESPRSAILNSLLDNGDIPTAGMVTVGWTELASGKIARLIEL